MPCCCKPSGRRRVKKDEPVDVIDSSLGQIPPAPPGKIKKDKKGLPCLYLENGESMIMPKNGKGALRRVFIGVGWRGGSGRSVDVDCSVNGFSKGVRSRDDTVYYGHLSNNATKRDGKDYVSIKHTGDILSGQNNNKDLIDLERIYVDLEYLPEAIDLLAFECNIYTSSVSFRDLDECYVRLVNADTNQEVMRFNVEKSSSVGSAAFSTSVMMMGTLTRSDDRWIITAEASARKETLQKMPEHQPEFRRDYIEGVNDSSPPPPKGDDDGPPLPDGMAPLPAKATAYAIDANESTETTETKRSGKVKMGRSVFLVPALAIGTAAGVAAAVAMFHPDPFSGASFNFGGLFDNVGAVALPDVGSLGDCLCCDVPLCKLDDLGPCGDCLGDTPKFIGENCACFGDQITGCVGGIFEASDQCFSGLIGGDCGDVFGACSACGDFAGDGVSSIFGICADIDCGGVADCLGGLCSALADFA